MGGWMMDPLVVIAGEMSTTTLMLGHVLQLSWVGQCQLYSLCSFCMVFLLALGAASTLLVMQLHMSF